MLLAPQSPFDNLVHWLERFLTVINTIGGLFAGLLIYFHKRIGRWWKERRKSRKPETIHLWNFLPFRKRDDAIALLEAINRGALERANQISGKEKPDKGRESKAARIWVGHFEEFGAAQHSYIAPGCEAFEDEQSVGRADGLETLHRWLEEFTTTRRHGKISVFGGAGVGKSTIVHQLFMELVRSASDGAPKKTPVPMFASARSVRDHAQRIVELRGATESSVIDAFVDVWLRNREIAMPDDERPELIDAFRKALAGGDIVLILDGLDELRLQQGLGDFTTRLLDKVECSVAPERSFGSTASRGKDRYIRLDDAWTLEQIREHLKARWPDHPDSQIAVAGAIGAIVAHHVESAAARHLPEEHYWLCEPSNLNLYLEDLDPAHLPSDTELRARAESQPKLFGRMVERAIKRMGSPDRNKVYEMLFKIALNDPGTGSPAAGPPITMDDDLAALVGEMNELVYADDNRVSFTQDALREYLAAGRIAWELGHANRAVTAGDALARDETWVATKRDEVRSWLRGSLNDQSRQVSFRLSLNAPGAPLPRTMRRNLLDLLIQIETEKSPRSASRKLEMTNPDDSGFTDLYLSEIAGNQLQLRMMHFRRCWFRDADLIDADLTCARFERCDFSGANLSGADAAGATFEECAFGHGQSGETNVIGMAIDSAEFIVNGERSQEVWDDLIGRHAVPERSRYQSEFGRLFSRRPSAILGTAVEVLDSKAYMPAISEAIRQWHKIDSSDPVYLVDMMAGGSSARIAALRIKFPRLHVLGVDRDPEPAHTGGPWFKWSQIEIGEKGSRDQDISLHLPELLKNKFGVDRAHVVVAKKALHELDRELQRTFLRHCADSLLPGGRLVLFADAPGTRIETMSDGKMCAAVDGYEPLPGAALDDLNTLRKVLGNPCTEPADAERALKGMHYDGTINGQIAFSNTWIMLKDWANGNRHEVRHRYFASVPEIIAWAKEWFEPPTEIPAKHYRLNPLNFNERGTQRVLHELEAGTSRDHDRAQDGLAPDVRRLSGWISEGDRFRVLVDYTNSQLASGSELAEALNAKSEKVPMANIHPTLAPLKSIEAAPSFDLTCAVLIFQKT